ncbi:MAG: N-acetylmuramoyl-L-alanine amidase [Elusimicrobia bacterium]|nr:N-acetylmuramoyl-L-alanine amidase [Elusimicrobiota bacterium]
MKPFFFAGMAAVLLMLGNGRSEMVGWTEEGTDEAAVVSTQTIAVPLPGPAQKIPLKIVHPPEGASLPAVKSSFVFGWADPQGTLTVNGQAVKIHKGGGWLTMVPYSPGPFEVRADLLLPTTSYAAIRRVTVASPPTVSTPTVLTVLQPELSLTLQAGERVLVEAQGPPGREATFQVEGVPKRFLMEEVLSNGRGVYRGYFLMPEGNPFKDAVVRVALYDKKSWVRTNATAQGRLTRLDRRVPMVVEVATAPVILRAAPGPATGGKSGYVMFPPEGTRLTVTGRRGDEYRVALTATRDAWIGVDDVKTLAGPVGLSPARVSAVSVEPSGRHTLVRAALGAKIPFEVRPAEGGRVIDVLFYGAVSDTDWIHYRGTARSVTRVEWFQDDGETYRLRVHLKPGSWWGYDGRFENGSFVLELRRPPENRNHPSSLAGLKIALDPGHSADRGAMGPTELLEKDANLAIALCLEKKLMRAGANVFWVRQGSENVKVYDRPKRAWDARADLLISVHNNALPEGANPFERTGYGVYYFHPQSHLLAEKIHAAYGAVFRDGKGASGARLRDDGLHYGNLALARTPQMPSVLTESAYMIRPEEEDLLRTESFQCDCAEAMFHGAVEFVRDFRRLSEK